MANNVGVFVSRATAGPLAFGPDPGDNVYLAIRAERGLSNIPTLITSMSRFRAAFGGALSSALGFSSGYLSAEVLFSKGVRRMYVLRVVGAGALAATVDLNDRAGTPLPTLKVLAKGEGVWGNSLDVVVEDGTLADTFRLRILDGSGAELEKWDNLLMNDSSFLTVNGASDYVQLQDLGSATAAPDNRPATGTFNLGDTQAGADGAAPADSDVIGTENLGVKTGLKAFRDNRLGRGFLMAPDLDFGSTVRDEMKAQLLSHYHIPMYSGAPAGSTPTAAIADVATAKDVAGGGYYYPRQRVRDLATQQIKTIPAAPQVVADYLRILPVKGPGKAPAGDDFAIQFALGLETQANGQPLVDAPVAELLVAAGINPVYDRNGKGPRCWGARAASNDTTWQYLYVVYQWALIASRVQDALDQLVYENTEGGFFTDLRLGVRNFMIDLHGQEAFRGRVPLENETADPEVHAFDVRADEELLSDADKNNGIARVEIWFRPAGTAETILVTVAKRNEG